jgi:hypothetical protein
MCPGTSKEQQDNNVLELSRIKERKSDVIVPLPCSWLLHTVQCKYEQTVWGGGGLATDLPVMMTSVFSFYQSSSIFVQTPPLPEEIDVEGDINQ